jgi:hypothetical protein
VRSEGEVELEAPRVTFTSQDGDVQELPDTAHGERRTYRVPLSRYFAGVPKRFHDPERFSVERTVKLSLTGQGSEETLVRDAEGALVWRD